VIIKEELMEVVINAKYGGFSLSHEAILRYAELKEITLYTTKDNRYAWSEDIYYYTSPNFEDSSFFSSRDIERNDPYLVQVVKEMGRNADGNCAKLKIVEIPDDVKWHITDYDGFETVAENHRVWG
jgi:hypothetical protein